MLTCISKILIYMASYFPLYIILIIRILFVDRNDNKTFLESVWYNFNESIVVISILLIMFVISACVLYWLKNIQTNTRHRQTLTQNATIEIASFLFPYIVSILTIELDWYGWLINLIIFIACGVFIVISDVIQVCPVFLFLGYKLYKDDKEHYVFTRLTREQYNQLLLDELNGVEARLMTSNVSLIKRKKFN